MTFQTTYNLSMALCDEMITGGTVNVARTKSYLAKAPSLLTILHAEVCQILDIPSVEVISLADTPLCGDYVTTTVLPYGLAAMFLADENPQVASFMQQKYEEARRRIPFKAKPITDVYNLGGRPR